MRLQAQAAHVYSPHFALGRVRVAAVLFRSRPCLRNCCRRDACSFLPRLPYSRYRSVTPDRFCSRPCRPMSRYACFFCARARVFATPIRFRSRPVSRHALSFLLAPMSSLRLPGVPPPQHQWCFTLSPVFSLIIIAFSRASKTQVVSPLRLCFYSRARVLATHDWFCSCLCRCYACLCLFTLTRGRPCSRYA